MSEQIGIRFQLLALAVQAMDAEEFKTGKDKTACIMDLAEKMVAFATVEVPAKGASLTLISGNTLRN